MQMTEPLGQSEIRASSTPRLELTPFSRLFELGLAEFWRYRELLYFLVWRDAKARYKQTAVGGAWAIIQPLLTMVVFTLVFGRLAKMPSDGVPYPIFAYSGLLAWTLFSSGINRGAISLVSSNNLVTKVYFPRVMIPLSSLGIPLIDLFFSMLMLLALMAWYRVEPGLPLLALPGLVVLATLSTLGITLWLAPLHVKYRDIGHSIRFLIQIWMFLTPVAYPLSVVPEKWRLLYSLNPMAGIVEAFRWSILGTRSLDSRSLLLSTVVTVLLTVTGLLYFKRSEQTFADVI